MLVQGTGGVALFGLQFARLHGAQVIVVSGGEDKRAQALALGAIYALARDAGWPAEVRRLTQGRGAEQVLETVGGPNFGRSLEALAQGGRVAVIGVLEGARSAARLARRSAAAARFRASAWATGVRCRRWCAPSMRTP
ncbi:MAG TPA: zinc-binding dehydrogenase [Pseudorhodoferax sp.]|nr:zinc-binding dehydrogenase [Pseudorhodoferax sp.]